MALSADARTVLLAGGGPAADAAASALTDADASVTRGDLTALPDHALGVVVGTAGSDGFRRANDAALDAGTPWLAVEVGGLGGRALADVDAGVSVLGPDTCFSCLRRRIASADPDAAEKATADPSAVRLAGAHAGHLAVRGLRGERVAGTVLELPHAEHRLLAAPNCDCGSAARTLDRADAGTRSLDDAVAAAEDAVDERLGPVTLLGERESFPAPYYLAGLCDTAAFGDGEVGEHAAGVALDWDAAFVKAVGEALERYTAAIYDADEFPRGPPDVDAGVHPDEFVRPDWGLPDELAWTDGVNLATGEDARLPAEFVVFPPEEETLAPAITTGLGLGNSTAEALVSGLTEVVERDATMLAWYSTFDPLGLQVADDRYQELAKRARAEDLSVTALLVTQDVDVPVVAVAVHRDGEWPNLAFGSSASLDVADAATGALCEALQNWMELRAMGPEGAREAGGAIARYADYPRDAEDFLSPDTTVPARSVGPDAVPEHPGDRLDALVDAVTAADLTPYAAGLTTRDVDALGFETARVLVPGAQPLFLGDSFFGDRARRVPRDLGYRPRFDAPPHPFP